MAEEEKSAGSGFGKLVYGTLKGNGINTDDLSFDEAVKKFNELGGTDNWHAKIMRKEAEEKAEKEERSKAEKKGYAKTKLSETGIPQKDQDQIKRIVGNDEVESYKDGKDTFIRYKSKDGNEIELKYDENGKMKRIFDTPSRSVEEVEKEMDVDVKQRIESACKQHNLDKQKVMEYLIEETKVDGSNKNAIELKARTEFGSGIYWRNPSEELKEFAGKDKKSQMQASGKPEKESTKQTSANENPNEYKGYKIEPGKYGLLKVSHPNGDFYAADLEDAKNKIEYYEKEAEKDRIFNENLKFMAQEREKRKVPLTEKEKADQRKYWARRKPGKTY